MTPGLRTYFFHSTLPPQGLKVKNPAGWKKLSVSIERDENFHSLVEYFKGSFSWYGNALETLAAIEESHGVQEQIGVVFHVSVKINEWQTLYEGQLFISQTEKIYMGSRLYRINAPVLQVDLWTKLIGRKDVKVDLNGDVDVDGAARVPVAPVSLHFRSQKLLKESEYNQTTPFPFSENDMGTGDTFSLGFENVVIKNEIKKNENVETKKIALQDILYIFTLEESGEYRFEINVLTQKSHQQLIFPFSVTLTGFEGCTFYIQFNNETPVALSKSTVLSMTTHALDQTYQRVVGDKIKFWGVVDNDNWKFLTTTDTFYVKEGSFLKITAGTTFQDTFHSAFLIYDAARSIVSKIVGQDNVTESVKFTTTQYAQNVIIKGSHLRGFTSLQRPFALSFMEWWNGIDPVLNLSVGMEDGKIFIEDKSYVYNQTVILNLAECANLVRSFEEENYFKTIEVGFSKWSAESDAGSDEVNATQTVSSKVRQGSEKKILSGFFAAALGIERARRNTDNSKDDRLDNEVCFFSTVDNSFLGVQNELSENFIDVVNVSFYEARINLRHSPRRILSRWRNFIETSYSAPGVLTFATGAANTQMISRLQLTDYEHATLGGYINEREEFVLTNQKLFVPKIWRLKNYKMTLAQYQTLVANKNNAVGISRGTSSFAPMFILQCDFFIFESRADFTFIQATDQEP